MLTVGITLVLSAGCAALQGPESLPGGVEARVTLRVVDTDGNVVTGANAQVSFAMASSEWIKGITDGNGLFTAQGKSRGEMLYDVQKKGHYRTKGVYCFPGAGDIVLDGGKWVPWNPTNTVVLKPIKNPVAMCARRGGIVIPVVGEALGYDLERGDWVAPHGKGTNSDVMVSYRYEGADFWTFSKSLSLTFGTNSLDGVRRYKKDGYSELKSLYEAPTDGYERSVSWSFERTKEKVVKDTGQSEDQYVVFRVRTQLDAEGNILKANYGKI